MIAVLAMETAAAQKRRSYAGILREPRTAPHSDPGAIKQALRSMRGDAIDRQESLVSRVTDIWSQDKDLQVTIAADADDAVRAIAAAGGDTRRIAINKSSVVRNELLPKLQAAGFRVMEPYYEQFHPFENRFMEYWQLPHVRMEYRRESFQVTQDLGAVRRNSIETNGAKDVIGVLGVNAASGSDGSVTLMQHGHNISDIFTKAREVMLVIGLDKIVADQEAAIFQTQCMALYGSESLLLDLRYREASGESYESLPFTIPPELVGRKVHIILLDNGRSHLLNSRHRELLLCIDCRACARACPIGEIESREGHSRRSPKEYIYAQALQMNPLPRTCLQCRRCESVCPVSIGLPDLILEARAKEGVKLPGSLADFMLGNPEALLHRASTLSPVYNTVTGIGLFRWLGEKTAGISKERQPPKVHRSTFAKWFHSHSGRSSNGAQDGR